MAKEVRRAGQDGTEHISADILRLMLGSAQDAIYAVELPAVRMLHATPAFPRRLGLPDDFLERGFDFALYLEHVHPEDRRAVQGIMGRILASRSDGELPESPARYRLGPLTGPWRHIEDHFRVLRHPGGEPRLIVGNSRDATGEVHAREALKRTQESFRSLAENSRDIFFSIRIPQMRYEFISSQVQELHGISPGDFYADPSVFMGCVAPQWRETVMGWVEEMARGEVRESYAFEVLDRQGRLRWMEQRTVLVPAPDGEGMLMLGVAQDKTEERAAREELQRSEERYRQLAEGWTDHVVMRINLRSMRHEYVSPSAERMFGYAPSRFYDGDPEVLGAVAPEWREQVALWMRQAAEGRLEPEYEYEVYDARGRRRWVRQRGVLLPGEDGSPLAVQFFMTDVTEAKRMALNLEQSEERYRQLAESWHDQVVYRYRLPGMEFEYVSPSVERILGYTPQQYYDNDPALQRALLPEWRDKVAQWIGELQRGVLRPEYEYEVYDAWGRRRWLKQHGTLLRGPDGAPAAVQYIVADVTDHKRLEEEFRRSEAFLEHVIEQSPVSMWISDENGTLIRTNRALRERLKIRDEEVVGRYNIFQDEQALAQGHMPAIRRVFENGGSARFELAYDTARTTGLDLAEHSSSVLDFTISAVQDESGRTTNLIIQHVDISEQKRAEEQLRATNERFALLAENVEDVIWTLDAELRWTFLTPSAETMTGIPLERLMGMGFSEVFTPRSMQAVAQAMAARSLAMTEGRATVVHTLEMELVRADGELVPLEVIVRPLLNADGSLAGYCGISRDISQRRAAEEALQRSERRFSELVRNSTDTINILNAEGIQIFASGATERMLGYAPEELVGIPVIEAMIHPEDREAVQNAFAAAIRHGVGRVQYRHRHRNGSWVHLEAWGTNQLDNPDIRGVVVNVRDITDRKLAEAALQRSERLFRKLLESMHEGVWAFDSRYRTIFANERLGAMLGYTLEELVRKTPWEITAPEQADLVHRTLAKRRAGVAGTTEYTLLRKDGSRLLAQVTSSPLMDERGDFEGQVCGIVDLTNRLHLEREVRRNQARLEALYELSRLTGATEAQIASFTLEQALALSESAAGALFFVGADGRTLEPRAAKGAHLPGPPPSFMLEARTLWGQVAESGVPAIINEGRPDAPPLPQGHPELGRFLGVPALDGGRSVAVLGLAGKAEGYDEADVLQLSLLVDGMWRIVRARRDEESIRASLREKEALLREVHHRVKNNLQVVSSLLDMSGRRLSEPEARQAMAEVQAKVQAMSLIHILLYGSGDGRGINLGEYVGALFRQLREVYGGAGLALSARLHLGGLVLGLDQAVPLGLALNEALANVFKHAASGTAGQSVEVRAERGLDGVVTLTVRDQGPGLPPGMAPEDSTGLGMRLMRGLVEHQLGGSLSIENAPEGGVLVTLRFRPACEQAATD